MPLRLGTRASALAQWQAEWVAAQLKQRNIEVTLVPITTTGDRLQDAIQTIGGQPSGEGVFTKEIQRALLDGRIDLAVHSLKDLPTRIMPGLCLAAVPERGPVADVLITTRMHLNVSDDASTGDPAPCRPLPVLSLSSLPTGAMVGTGSLRRQTQLLHVRRDLQMRELRGNVETRLRKLLQGDCDALILAEAGLRRLKLLPNKGVGSLYLPNDLLRFDNKDSRPLYSVLPLDIMLPAIGQGALGLETRSDDRATMELVATLDHPASHATVLAERELLSMLQGGCLAPIAALATIDGAQLTLTGRVISHDGVQRLEATESVAMRLSLFSKETDATIAGRASDWAIATSDAKQLGRRVAEALLARGAAQLIGVTRAS